MRASDTLRITPNFTMGEFTKSTTAEIHGIAIAVEVDSTVHANLINLCSTVLQPLRDALGQVQVTSGYRTPELNNLIGGSATSQHMRGLAADIKVPGRSPMEVAEWIRDNIKEYDQLIHEHGIWVHVSVAPAGRVPRGECLTATKVDSTTRYVQGIHSIEHAMEMVA